MECVITNFKLEVDGIEVKWKAVWSLLRSFYIWFKDKRNKEEKSNTHNKETNTKKEKKPKKGKKKTVDEKILR